MNPKTISRRRLIETIDAIARHRSEMERAERHDAAAPARMEDDGAGGAIRSPSYYHHRLTSPPVGFPLPISQEAYRGIFPPRPIGLTRADVAALNALADAGRIRLSPEFAPRPHPAPAVLERIAFELTGELPQADDAAVRAAEQSVFPEFYRAAAEGRTTTSEAGYCAWTSPDPVPSRTDAIDCEPGERLTVYAVGLVFVPRYRGGRPTRVMVRQFTVRGERPLDDREAIAWALDLILPNWPVEEWGAVTQYDPPTGIVSATLLKLPGHTGETEEF